MVMPARVLTIAVLNFWISVACSIYFFPLSSSRCANIFMRV